MRISDWSSDVCSSDLSKAIRTPVNFIVHSVDEVNAGLAHGRYFFMDVARDGIALYQAVDDELPEPQPKTPHAALEMALEYFDEWLPAAKGMQETADFSMQNGRLKDAAFLTHQARSEEHTSELQSLMRISYAVFCLKKKKYISYELTLNI